MESKFSKEEAVNFLEITCGITEPLKEFSVNKIDLLPKILQAFLHIIPFQNLTLLSKNKQDRRVPTEDEIKQEVLSKRGGMCFTINAFLHALLEAIGYDVDFTIATVHEGGEVKPEDHGNHAVVLVRKLTAENSLHIADVGSGYPQFEPVSLDFEDESNKKIYNQSFNTYQYIKEDNKYNRLHLRSNPDTIGSSTSSHQVVSPNGSGDWVPYYTFQLVPCKYGDDLVRSQAATVYNWPSDYHFHRVLRMIRWKDGKAIAIKGYTLLLENDHGKLEASKLRTREEVKKKILEYFPGRYSSDEIETALKNTEDEQ